MPQELSDSRWYNNIVEGCMTTREELLFLAHLQEQTERFSEMAETVTKLVSLGEQLTPQQRNLFSVAFKNMVNPKRSALRTIKALFAQAERKQPKYVHLLKQYEAKLIREVLEDCEGLIALLDRKLIKEDSSKEGQTFYYKMKGDYYRYMSWSDNSGARRYSDLAEQAYKKASELSLQGLPSTHPTRLGLALNRAVYYYEIIRDTAKAVSLAKEAFDQAIADIDSIDEEHYRDSTQIMQLLRDNLTMWVSDLEGEEEPYKDKEKAQNSERLQ